MRALVLVLLLAACAADPLPPPPPPEVPAELRVCPPGAPSPTAPPPPRNVRQLVDWALGVHAALIRTQAARDVCASRLSRLNRWIATEGSHQ